SARTSASCAAAEPPIAITPAPLASNRYLKANTLLKFPMSLSQFPWSGEWTPASVFFDTLIWRRTSAAAKRLCARDLLVNVLPLPEPLVYRVAFILIYSCSSPHCPVGMIVTVENAAGGAAMPQTRARSRSCPERYGAVHDQGYRQASARGIART